jgi:predicted peroxiredoxin
MKQLKADITALRVDFDVDVFKVDKGVYVLAREQPNQQDFLNFVSPAHSTKGALLDYCKTNFDDVLHYLYPDRDVQRRFSR